MARLSKPKSALPPTFSQPLHPQSTSFGASLRREAAKTLSGDASMGIWCLSSAMNVSFLCLLRFYELRHAAVRRQFHAEAITGIVGCKEQHSLGHFLGRAAPA